MRERRGEERKRDEEDDEEEEIRMRYGLLGKRRRRRQEENEEGMLSEWRADYIFGSVGSSFSLAVLAAQEKKEKNCKIK